jgi:small subunit ribosomal protein S6
VAATAPTYDLMLLLDAEADPQARERVLGEAREAIAGGGELLRDDAWGDRALAYAIEHKATANYHLLQFRAASPELLERLDRALRFADEVVRFRIVKLAPGTPDPPRPPAAERSASAPPPAPAESQAPPAAPVPVAAQPAEA